MKSYVLLFVNHISDRDNSLFFTRQPLVSGKGRSTRFDRYSPSLGVQRKSLIQAPSATTAERLYRMSVSASLPAETSSTECHHSPPSSFHDLAVLCGCQQPADLSFPVSPGPTESMTSVVRLESERRSHNKIDHDEDVEPHRLGVPFTSSMCGIHDAFLERLALVSSLQVRVRRKAH